MAFGLDIYRYQNVTSYQALKNAGVTFGILKLSDGLGTAFVRGDAQVKWLKCVGIPTGGYHFAQKGDPRRQARVFKAELTRLTAVGVIPALDIENTGVSWGGKEARDFSLAFCDEMLQDYPRVLLYANTSELKAMDATAIVRDLPGVYVWEANYGSNNGVRHSLPANPWANRRAIHQYTSKGRINGIAGDTDFNEGLLGLILMSGKGVDDLSWNDKSGVKSANDPNHEYSYGELLVGSNVKDNENHQLLTKLVEDVQDVKTQARPVTLSASDKAEIVAELRSTLVGALADELDARARDGNPNTGPVSNT